MTLEEELNRGLHDLARGAGPADGLGPDIRRAAARRRTHLIQARAALAAGALGTLVVGFVAWRGSTGDDVKTVPVAPNTTTAPTPSPSPSPNPIPDSTGASSTAVITVSQSTFVGVSDDADIAEFDVATGQPTRVLVPVTPAPTGSPQMKVGLTVVKGEVYVLYTPGTCGNSLSRLGDKRDPLVSSGPNDSVSAFAVSPDGGSMAWVLTSCATQEATLMVQMADAPTAREVQIGPAPPSVNDLSLANDGRVALGLSSSAANAETVGVLPAGATSLAELDPIHVGDGCEAARPRFLADGSLTVVSCAVGDPAASAVFRLVDTSGAMSRLFDLPAGNDGHATDRVTAFDWNDSGTDAIFEQTGHVYQWNATGGTVEIATTASAVGY